MVQIKRKFSSHAWAWSGIETRFSRENQASIGVFMRDRISKKGPSRVVRRVPDFLFHATPKNGGVKAL
jgi:hypothetical protein